MSTNAIRDIHKAYPGEYLTDIRSPAPEIFYNSPYITPIADGDPEAEEYRLDYEDIHKSGWSGLPFATGHLHDLAKNIGRDIPPTSLRPDIFLTQDEKLWPSPVTVEYGFTGKYWIINAGIKNDYTLKWYPYHQEVVNLLKDKITLVQVGQLEHDHPPLEGVIDMRGKTDLRQLFRLSYHAEGAINAISLQMVIMAALAKPDVVIAGGREGVRWQIYPDHRFLYTHGALECCKYDGCWKSKLEDCVNKIDKVPLCMNMIRPEDVARAVEMYYEGGRLTYEEDLCSEKILQEKKPIPAK